MLGARRVLAEWFPTAPRLREIFQFGFTVQEDWSGEERLVPVREPGSALQGVSPGSPDLSRPLSEREAVLLRQNQAQPRKESMGSKILGLGLQGPSRKGLGLGPPHTRQLHREDVQPATPILAQCQLRQRWGCFLLWVWIKGMKGQGPGVSRCLKSPSCFAGCPLFHLHLLAFVSKSLHQNHRRAKTFHPSPAQRFPRAC